MSSTPFQRRAGIWLNWFAKQSRGKTVDLTRRGKVVAMLLARKHRERLVSPSRRWSEAWRAFTSEFDLAELAIDPDEIFAVRDRST